MRGEPASWGIVFCGAASTSTLGWIGLIALWIGCEVMVPPAVAGEPTTAETAPRAVDFLPPAPRVDLRRPVALLLRGRSLWVANERSGTLSVVELPSQDVRHAQVGKSLSDLEALPGKRVAVCDPVTGEVVVLRESPEGIQNLSRTKVAASPVTLKYVAATNRLSVASLWARRLTLLEVGTEADNLAVRAVVDLDFSPRMQCLLADGRTLVVADAFQGRLAIVDSATGEIISRRLMEGHNIRGLALSRDGSELLVAHQLLNSRVPTIAARITWGQVINNLLRTIRTDHLLDPTAAARSRQANQPIPIAHWSLQPLGGNGDAAGDPGDLIVTDTDERIVCLSGVNQIGIVHPQTGLRTRIRVGRRPTAVIAAPETPELFVANTLDDTITIVDRDSAQVRATIELGHRLELCQADRGEQFFYDARLSLDGWYSCHSCHTDGHTTGLLNDNFGDGNEGTPKRILSLRGTATTFPWAWDGGQSWLSNQIHQSLLTTMRGDETRAGYDGAVDALTDYLRLLPPAPSLTAARGQTPDAEALGRGKKLFADRGCAGCHESTVYTSFGTYDVGLADEAGNRSFNPPSLRGVSQLPALFHDNRARDLRDVLVRFGHPNGESKNLTSDELNDLVSFLQSL